MKLLTIEISNFRSIAKKAIISEKSSRLFTLVGANNLGKSNFLRAINLFFNREVEPGLPFNPITDLTQDATGAVISINLQFTRAEDKRMTTYIDNNHETDFKEYIVPVTLVCQSNGRLQYSFSGEKGQRKTFPELIERIQEYVNCIYIPSIKDYRTVIDAQMMRKIVGATFQGWGRGRYGSKTIGEQKEKFKKLLAEIQSVLDESGNYVSGIISSVVPSIEKFAFSLPYDHLEDFLGRLLFTIKEKHLNESITLGSVGSGVQSFAIFSMLRLLHEIRPTNTHRKSKFIWLIEEPETFMHHDLQRKTYEKLKSYSQDGHIFISTHSPVFVDKHDFGSSFLVTHNGKSTELSYITTNNLRDVIAGNLGVSFADFFEFGRFNVLVEGESDRKLLTELNKLFESSGEAGIIDLDQTEFLVCGTVNAISHFYHMYNTFNRYADFIAVFDRDDPGIRERTKLLTAGVPASNLILIPESPHLEKNRMEDIVDREVWETCLRKLDSDGLIELHMKQDKITGYQYHYTDRVEVKKKFVEYLLKSAKKDLKSFSRYLNLLREIKVALARSVSST
jgi:predicted ATP-dependent endonuclease of OLD family